MQLPSNKVGFVLIAVVLVVVAAVFGSKIKPQTPLEDLKSVELLVTRNTDSGFKSGDSDQDGLADWLEELYGTDPNNPDTDGDGTSDGDEIKLGRDPLVPGPNDPLLTRADRINMTVGTSTPGSPTDQASIDLFTQYMLAKREGTLTPEETNKIVEDISQKVASEHSLEEKYSLSNLNITESNKETITIYGDRIAQSAISFFMEMDSFKALNDTVYLSRVAQAYKAYAEELALIRVPSVSQDVHLLLVNHTYKTGVMFDIISQSGSDPMATLVITTQFQASGTNEQDLYTSLALYFQNNDIIFDTESTVRFWQNFAN